MSPLKTSLLIAILAVTSACGRQVVEFKDGDLDAGTDARIDGSVDAPIDGPLAVRPTVISTMPASNATGVALNTLVTATFSKPMNAGTLTTTTFTLRQGSTALTGVVTVNPTGTTATFTSAAPLVANLVYTATITTGAMDTGGLTLAANYTWMFTTASNALPPTVTAVTPAPSATNVSLNVSPTATFSKAMNMTTINMTTFTLVQGATPIAGVVTLNSATNTATFNPTLDLTAGLVYTATITTGAMDTGGLALAANYTWMFTTGTVVLPPTVTVTTPAPGATSVALTVSPTATFSRAMNAATINATTFTLFQGLTPVTGVVTYDALTNTAMFNPAVDLTTGLIYTATITTGAQDTNGVALAAPFSWMFTTGVSMLPPTVTTTTPLANAMNVPVTVSPTARFSQPMNMLTINDTTFTLFQGLTPIVGVVSYNALTNTATFDPTVDLTTGLLYTATITTGAQDTNGQALAMDFTWSFTTGAACVLPPILLGTAGNFAVLAGSTVTSTGFSIVNSNLGVFPGTAVVGFPPGVVNNGAIIAGTAVAGTAQDDLTIAHVDGLGRTDCLTSIVGDLGGLTLAPGLYKSTSFFEITTADLILDAQGDANAVWIFAATSRLDVANGRQVTIIGGGSAANVFWVLGSSAALGTGVRMVGNILADQAITMATGAVLNGRALARIAEVTLDTTTVTPP